MVAAEYGPEHQYIYASLNHSGDEDRILWGNEVKTMAADALATQVARTSAAMVLTMEFIWVLVFQKVSEWLIKFDGLFIHEDPYRPWNHKYTLKLSSLT